LTTFHKSRASSVMTKTIVNSNLTIQVEKSGPKGLNMQEKNQKYRKPYSGDEIQEEDIKDEKKF
jgi:hypothetical protein